MKSVKNEQSSYKKIYTVVRKIPEGKIATYGQIARLAGLPGHARQVGYALHALHDSESGLPWFRVINSRGEISFPMGSPEHELQRTILVAEGVCFDERCRVDLRRFQWKK
jgi:methylated-DNA-protein-cysteine methyltransferase-like protein